jgi:hypothetical protein
VRLPRGEPEILRALRCSSSLFVLCVFFFCFLSAVQSSKVEKVQAKEDKRSAEISKAQEKAAGKQ